jgi:hypothetical protein
VIFAKHLRDRVARGEVTASVRIWRNPRVRIGGRYPMAAGSIMVTAITEIDLDDITDDLARRSGFADVDALLLTARHGRGERVFVVEFRYTPGS